MERVGFIMLRHVNNSITNSYWNYSYDCIRKYYPENVIIIVDDNSNYEYINNRIMYKTVVINSEYPQRGELLPYYYYLHNKLFEVAVIIHDSVFINKYFDFNVDKYKMLWEFDHHWDQIEDETNIIKLFDEKLMDFYEDKKLWKGCFGAMSIISHDYLVEINKNYDISKLLSCVLNRYNRCSFERVIACLLQLNEPKVTLLGNIKEYCRWGITINELSNYQHLPIIKVWTGR